MSESIKYLKLEELKNGGFYKCRLSGNQVIVHITFNGDNVNVCTASYYSEINGMYNTMIPFPYQLYKI